MKEKRPMMNNWITEVMTYRDETGRGFGRNAIRAAMTLSTYPDGYSKGNYALAVETGMTTEDDSRALKASKVSVALRPLRETGFIHVEPGLCGPGGFNTITPTMPKVAAL